jgi:hypothetical protein
MMRHGLELFRSLTDLSMIMVIIIIIIIIIIIR